MCVVCVIGVLRRRTGWSVEWWISDLYDLCSRFLCRSPVLETQHVHDSRMVMVRWFFAGKFSVASSGTTSCTDCDAGKYSATAGVESVCVVCVCVFSKKKKRDTYTLYHTQFIHNTYKWRKHKSVSTNNRLVSYTHSLSLSIDR